MVTMREGCVYQVLWSGDPTEVQKAWKERFGFQFDLRSNLLKMEAEGWNLYRMPNGYYVVESWDDERHAVTTIEERVYPK